MTRAIFSSKFWADAIERAIKTAAQAIILAVGQDLTNVNLFQADLANVAGLAGSAAALSVLMSIVSAPFGEPDSASLVSK